MDKTRQQLLVGNSLSVFCKEALFCCFDQENHKMHLFELTSSVMRVKDVKTEVTIRIN